MRDYDAASDHHCHVQGFFLLGAGDAQAVGLNGMIENAVVATEDRGRNQSHQLFRLGRQRAFQIRVVIDVVKTFDEEIVGLLDVRVEALARIKKAAGGFALVGHVFFSEEVSGLFPLLSRTL